MKGDKALGVALCAAATLGFVATYLLLAAARPSDECRAGVEHVGCHWPSVGTMLLGACGLIVSFAMIVTGVLALLVSAARARDERDRASLRRARPRLSSAVREPH